MLDEAIKLIQKEIEVYKVQDSNIVKSYRKSTIENRVKEKLQHRIKILEFILKILNKLKEDKLWIE